MVGMVFGACLFLKKTEGKSKDFHSPAKIKDFIRRKPVGGLEKNLPRNLEFFNCFVFLHKIRNPKQTLKGSSSKPVGGLEKNLPRNLEFFNCFVFLHKIRNPKQTLKGSSSKPVGGLEPPTYCFLCRYAKNEKASLLPTRQLLCH